MTVHPIDDALIATTAPYDTCAACGHMQDEHDQLDGCQAVEHDVACGCPVFEPDGAPWPTLTVLAEIGAERRRQDDRWGEQNHRDVDRVLMERPGGCTAQRMAEHYAIPTANSARGTCAGRFRNGEGTWADVLVEEVAEAIEAAVDLGPAALRAELVQIAAVAAAWVEAIDRRARP